ncbi:ABC transporter ATP-binding protein [Metamycoplasma neophronis]|uniref:ABC transporter ATP-binding protein n=1 Tax=Metamycoplasma neophronis TaxID=872983 RepID=A0ABY2Z4A1_9BACT|nr:ABC transporter ATP-binding protein [Metamycoplasma neophronis]TPR53702.1 ABC transporter ATP-binding protein [Metamycoplasma neophronis]
MKKNISENNTVSSESSLVIKNFLTILEEHDKEIKNNPRIEQREYPLEKIIDIKNVIKEFKIRRKKFRAVDDLNLTIYRNQNIALLGSNGAGKTTTVEMIVGIQKPTKGKIEYFFKGNNNEKDIDSAKIGIQFQDSSYPQGLTVKDVIVSMNKIYGNKMEPSELSDLIKIFGVNEFLYNKAASLSGGQHQRLNALLAIIHKPQLVILDELSTGLDIKVKSRLVQFLKSFIKANQSTLLIISHDIKEIENLADRIVILNKGKVVFDKTIEETKEEFGSISVCLDKYI